MQIKKIVFCENTSWWRAQPTEQLACLAHFSHKFAMHHPRPLKHYTKSEYLISICISKWSGSPLIQLATEISSFLVRFNLLATQVNCLVASLSSFVNLLILPSIPSSRFAFCPSWGPVQSAVLWDQSCLNFKKVDKGPHFSTCHGLQNIKFKP